MTKVAKSNYSEAEVAALRAGYTGADNKAEVAKLAAELGKQPASIRAKLTQLGVYQSVKPDAKRPKGKTKDTLVSEVAEKIGLAEHDRDGLAKATTRVLEAILAKLA